MAITAETRTDIIELVVTTLNAAPGTTLLNELAAIVDGGGTLADVAAALTDRADFKAIYPTFQTANEFATAWLSTLVPEASAEALAEGVAIAEGLLNGGASRADLMLEAQAFLSAASETDADFGTSAARFNNQVEVATYHTVTQKQDATDLQVLQDAISTVTSDDTTVAAANTAIDTGATDVGAKSFTLTTGIDTFTGGSAGDTFTGQIDDNTASANTLGAADVLDGGTGTDTLNVIADTSGGAIALPAANIKNIENVFFRNVSGQTLEVDATRLSGEQQIWSDRSSHQVDVKNISSGTTIGIRGDGSTTNGDVNLTYSGSATAGTLAIDGDTTAGDVVMTAAGMTSLSITSTGGTNKLGKLDAPATVKDVTIDATTSLDLGTGIGVAAAVDGTITVTGAATVDLGSNAIQASFDTIDASASSGGVTVTLDAETDTKVTGGSGTDTVTTGAVLATGSVDAGAGSDTLIVADSTHITSTVGKKYTNFETLRVNDGVTIDMDHVAGITSLQIVDIGGTTVVNDISATQAAGVVLLSQSGAMTLSVKNATTVGTIDSLTLVVTDGDSTTSEADAAGGDITVAGVETITISATDDFTLTTMANISGMTKLVATGPGDIDITTGAIDLGVNGVVDFSGLTATSVFNAAAAVTNAFAFTGGSGADTVTTSVIGGTIVNTGAGNDVITVTQPTGGTTGVTVEGGAGQDDVTVAGVGNDAIDRVVIKYAAGDSISDSSTSGISATLTDTVDTLNTTTAAAAAGNHVTFDTEVSATAVTAGTTNVTLGTTTVTNAGDFFVNIEDATNVYIYQDTDGDKIIEAGEFALHLTNVAGGAATAGDFTIVGGNLVFAGD
jgi:hypothetical protein